MRFRLQGLFFLLLAAFTLVAKGYAQVSEDSLLAIVSSSKPVIQDSLYYELYVKFRYSEVDKAENYAEKVKKLATEQKNDTFYIKSLHALGFLARRQSKFDVALNYFYEGLTKSLDINYKIGILMMYNDMGTISFDTQQYDKAIDNYLKVILYAKKFNEPLDEAYANNNIAGVYLNLGNYNEALNYYLACIQVKRKNNISNGLELNYCNTGLCYIELNEVEKAFETFNSVRNNCLNCPANLQAFYSYGLGRTYLAMEKYQDALEYLTQSLTISKNINESGREIANYFLIGRVFLELNDLSKSERYLDSATNIAINSDNKLNLLSMYSEYSKIFEKRNDYKTALAYKEKYIQLRDSLFKNDLFSNINRSFLNFQQSQNDQIIQGKESQILRNRQFAYILTLIALLLLIVLAFSYRTISYRRELSEKLNELVSLKTKELTNTNTMLVKSRQELDTFLYRTSHDIRGPIATLLGLTNLATLESKDTVTNSYLKRIDITAGKLNEVISRLTNVSQINSMPLDITTVNLYATVNEVVEDIRKRMGIENGIHFKLDGTFPESISTDKILLKIILTNLLENGFKFFDPGESESTVSLNIEANGKIDLSIHDNGVGINPEFREKIFELFFVASDKRGTGLGLYQAMLATQKLGGEITLISFKKPTSFKVSLPLI